jgi:hypothetical protein
MKKIFFALTFIFILALMFSVSSVMASGDRQEAFQTPTPGPDGRIIYVVQQGDSCALIATRMNMSIEQLSKLNNLDASCKLEPGQTLLIGIGGPALPSPTPNVVTPTAGAPTPTPQPSKAEICVLVYADVNGDAIRQEDSEGVVPGAAISVTGSSFSQTAVTIGGLDPSCFADAPQGEYNVSVAAPEGFNPTTELNYTLSAGPGETIYVAFGVQLRELNTVAATEDTNSSMLGIIGAVFVGLGIALAFYARQLTKAPKITLKR